MPETKTVVKVTIAMAKVTPNTAVGEPIQGNIPAKLHPRTKKKMLHRSGVNFFAGLM